MIHELSFLLPLGGTLLLHTLATHKHIISCAYEGRISVLLIVSAFFGGKIVDALTSVRPHARVLLINPGVGW